MCFREDGDVVGYECRGGTGICVRQKASIVLG
jgi:hypothetical protein